ncbi:MAG: phage adaptor protein [Dongiaceae bacterium]
MAIATYAELQTAIGNWLARPGDPTIAAIVPDWIALCELRINRGLRVRAMEERATATVAGAYLALPEGFLAMRNFQLNTNPVTALDLVSAEFIDRAAAGSATGRPRLYAIVNDEIQLAPAPDGPYTAEMAYWKKLEALSPTTSTNWLLTNAPDVYLFGALAEAAAYLGDDQHLAQWDGRYQAAIRQLQESDDAGRWSGATPQSRFVGATP